MRFGSASVPSSPCSCLGPYRKISQCSRFLQDWGGQADLQWRSRNERPKHAP